MSFNNCDVSKILFTSTVRWGTVGSGRAVVFEEFAPSEQAYERGFWIGGTKEDGKVIGGHRN